MVHEFVAGVLGLVAGGFFLTTIGFAVAWIRARERAILAEREAAASASPGSPLVRIEQAVEAVAIEVERLAEAERFQAKLLARRQTRDAEAAAPLAAPVVSPGPGISPPPSRAALPPHSVTPH